MNKTDRILEDMQKLVEISGISGSSTIFLPNLTFTIPKGDFEIPSFCDYTGAVEDFEWFLSCSEAGKLVPHQSPEKSFWLKTWGGDADVYGRTWSIRSLAKHLYKEQDSRRAVLYNPTSCSNPPCILCYHFQINHFRQVDVTVTMRSSDVAKILPQDVTMTWLLLKFIAAIGNYHIGDMTFNISNAHVYYEDSEWQEEFDVDFPL